MNRKNFSACFIAVFAGALFALPQPVLAEEPPTWQYGVSFSYLTGDYGSDTRSDILYAAAGIKRYFKKGDFAATVPYLDNANDGVIFIDGKPEKVEGAFGGSGLGDIIFKARYYAVEQSGPLPFIDLVGSVKLPTASEEKGLGTGKADFTLGAELAEVLPDRRWTALGEFGYTFVGDPAGYEAENRWLYSIGLSYECSRWLRFSGYLDGRTATFKGNENPLSMLLIGEFRLKSNFRLDTMLEVGMNDGSPDLGITVGLRKRI